MKLIHYSLPGLKAGTTLKDSSLPEMGNQALSLCLNKNDVLKNKMLLASDTLPARKWSVARQVHGDHLHEVTDMDSMAGFWSLESSIPETDALYTTQKNHLIGVYTADCAGLVVYDPITPLVCVIHSGWKGTMLNIVGKSIETLKEKGLLHPESTRVFISPCLLKPDFEFGKDMAEKMIDACSFQNIDTADLFEDLNDEKVLFDHQLMILRQLENCQIPSSNIEKAPFSTLSHEENGFSWRRDHKKSGEHFTFAWLESSDDE